MRRRRTSRSKRKQEKYGAITFVLVLLLVAAFVYAFQSLGIYGLLLKPVFQGMTQTPETSAAATTPWPSDSPAPTVSASGAGKITEEIKMNAITLYGVQLGVYTKTENAEATADKFKKEGSAGYLLKEDTLYRVVDSVFYNEADAKVLRDAYRQGSSPDACILRVEASGINWKVSATREQIDAIKGAVSVLQSQIIALINTQKAAQQCQGTADDWKVTIADAATKLKDARDTLRKAVGTTNSTVVQNLDACLTESADALAQLAKTDSADTVALLSGLKYDIIDLLIKLQQRIMS